MVEAEEEKQPESDASDDEEPMEVDGKAAQGDVPMETDSAVVAGVSKKAASGGAERAAAPKPAAPKPNAVYSGLPQSKGELEALIETIYNTVNNSVLPRLHRCLTAKVQHTHTYLPSSSTLVYSGGVSTGAA